MYGNFHLVWISFLVAATQHLDVGPVLFREDAIVEDHQGWTLFVGKARTKMRFLKIWFKSFKQLRIF